MMLRWLRTLRPLRASQIGWRLRRRLLGHRVPPLSGAPVPFRPVPLPKGSSIDYRVGADSIEFLSRPGKLGDWMLGPRSEQRLWTVTLHYHEWIADLVESGRREEAAKWLADWIGKVGPSEQHLAWNEYAVATRIQSWTRILNAAGELVPRLAAHLERQAEYLHGALAWDLRGNHLVRDLLGLSIAAAALDSPRAATWKETVRRVLPELLEEQILPDGAHYERSPMYHAIVLRDLLTLRELLADSALDPILLRMGEWQRSLKHPDGRLALFGDSALNGFARANFDPPNPGYRAFEPSGYAAWHREPWSLLFDVGPIGPDEQPGHGHAGILGFEASLGGHRLVVDPGTYGYDDDARRRYDRSSASHNGPRVGMGDSAELWGAFRVGRRAKLLARRFAESEVSATHDGFPGCPTTRTIKWLSELAFQVTDRVEGSGTRAVETGWLIHPEWKVTEQSEGWTLEGPGGRATVAVKLPPGGRRFRDQQPWHPEFGKELPATRIGWRQAGVLPIEVATTFTKA